ncbi:hypothetical protein OAA59_01540 [bacterium]|nr:hypothetical protein [bacterium]
MEIQCPSCEKPFTVSEQHYNQEVNCPYCSQSLFLEEQPTISNENSESKEAAKRARRRKIILDSLPKYLINPDAFTAIVKLGKREELNPDELLSLGKFSEAKEAMLRSSIKDLNLSDSEAASMKLVLDLTYDVSSPDAFIAHQLEKNPNYFEELEQNAGQEEPQKQNLVKRIIKSAKESAIEKLMQSVENSGLSDAEADKQRWLYQEMFKSKRLDKLAERIIKKTHPQLFKEHKQTDWVGLREKVDEFVDLKDFVKESKGAKIVLIAIAGFILLMIYLIY